MTVRELITRIGFEVDDSKMKQAQSKISKFKTGLKWAIGGTVAAIGLIGAASIKAAGDMEMLTTQFETMLGSSEKANAMMGQLKKFAATTPFQLPDLVTGTQNLLSFGVAEGDVVNTMRMLGDTAGGNREKLMGLVLAYGKVQAKGKASMEEINMLTERGLPIMKTLQAQLGVNEEQFFKLVSAGKIGKEQVTQAFRTMTSEGGMFFKGMERASLTFQGLVSTLKDNISLLLADLGNALLPVMKTVIKALTDLVSGPLGTALKSIITAIAPVITFIGELLGTVIEMLMPVFDALSPLLSGIMDVLKPLLGFIASILGLVKILNPILRLIGVVFKVVGAILEALMPIINPIIDMIVDFLTQLVDTLAQGLMDVLMELIPIIAELGKIWADIFILIMPLIQLVLNLILKVFKKEMQVIVIALKFILQIIARVYMWVGKIVKRISGWLLPVINTIISVITKLFSIAVSVFGGIIKLVVKLVLWMNKLTEPIRKFLLPAILKIGQVFKTVFTSIWSFFKLVVQGIKDYFNDMIDNIIATINGVITLINKSGLTYIDLITRKSKQSVKDMQNVINNNQKTTNMNVQNEFNINAPTGGAPGLTGLTPDGVSQIASQAVKSAFSIQLKKIIVGATY